MNYYKMLTVNIVFSLLKFFKLIINQDKAAELTHTVEIAAHNAQEKTKEFVHNVQGTIFAFCFLKNMIAHNRKS